MTLHPDADQIRALAEASDDGPVLMLNLLRFAPDGGREAYATYGELVAPHLQQAGASIRFRATADRTVIGPPDERWDEVIVVEYPSRSAFLTMVGDPDYQDVAEHRSRGLADSRLIACHA